MNPTLRKLVLCLADGEFHSGEELGASSGVSRAAVWKQLQQLQEWGVAVDSQKSRGYRIAGGLKLLDENLVRESLGGAAFNLLVGMQVHSQIESTNAELMAAIASGEDVHAHVCVAERQTAGRGRRGRAWQSPFGCNLYFSIAWRFDQGIAALEGLSLAVGVALCRSLESLGFSGVQLKWPNDLLVRGSKLGGVLLEIAGDVSGECFVVVGIGLNVAMPKTEAIKIDQPFVDLATISGSTNTDRSRLLAELLNELLPLLHSYQRLGFEAYREEWQSRNAHAGQLVNLTSAKNCTRGRVVGVSGSGGLLLDVAGDVREFVGGEVSLRAEA